jgi:hypothetical protein
MRAGPRLDTQDAGYTRQGRTECKGDDIITFQELGRKISSQFEKSEEVVPGAEKVKTDITGGWINCGRIRCQRDNSSNRR